MNLRVLSFLLLLPVFSIAQTNYKKGYVISNSGDTLHGFINYREWYRNPESIAFRKSTDDLNTQQFTPNEATGFAIAGYEAYARHLVSISRNEVRDQWLQELPDTSTVSKVVFLKLISRGDRLDLYSYTDALKERFYIHDRQQAVPAELIYRKMLRNTDIQTDAVYHRQLLTLAAAYGALSSALDQLIQTAEYSKTDLKKIVAAINTMHEPSTARHTRNERKSTFFVSAGVHKNKIRYTGQNLITVDGLNAGGHDKFKEQVITEAYVPRLSAGLDIFINPAVQKLVIRTEVAVTGLKSTAQSYYKEGSYSTMESFNTYRFSAINASFAPQVLYHFYNAPAFKWYVGIGGAFNYTKAQENDVHIRESSRNGETEKTIQDYYPVRPFSLSALLTSGVQFRQRLGASLLWGNPVEHTDYAIGKVSAKSGLFALAVYYTVGKP